MSRASPHDVVSINREAATKEKRRRCAVCPMTASHSATLELIVANPRCANARTRRKVAQGPAQAGLRTHRFWSSTFPFAAARTVVRRDRVGSHSRTTRTDLPLRGQRRNCAGKIFPSRTGFPFHPSHETRATDTCWRNR